MQKLVVGGQRQGKTFFCVRLMIDYLQTTDRHIYTNLPIYPDEVAKCIVKNVSRNPINKHKEMIPYLERMHIIRRFPDLEELRDFRKKSPVYCQLHHGRNRKLDYQRDENFKLVLDDFGDRIIPYNPDRLFFPIECIFNFWKYKRMNSVIMLDEFYNYFNSADYKYSGQQMNIRRREVLNYTRQHGHDKDDLFFVTHNEEDLDVNVKRGTQYTYKCYNSLYRNMIPKDVLKRYHFTMGWLKGLKHMKMYFMIEGFDRDNASKDPDDFWSCLPDKKIFKCYNSFSKREGVGKIKQNKVKDSYLLSSSDINKSKLLVLKEFFIQGWLPLAVLLFSIFTIYLAYGVFHKLIYQSRKGVVVNGEGSKVVAVDEKKPDDKKKPGEVVKKKPVKITGVSPSSIYYDDGFRIEKGSSYEGFEIVEIGRVTTLVERAGQKFRVATRGIRTEAQTE